MDDVELVALARDGDRSAFGELVERHRSSVCRAARAALGSDHEADDVAQDACLAAYRRLKSFNGTASFRTWLLTITWNKAINHRRAANRWWRRLAPSGTNGKASDPPAPHRSPEDAAGDRQLYEAIREEVRSLSDPTRDALLLAQAGEYSYEEIGRMLGTPVGTVKWRVSEARRLIKLGLQARGFHCES